MSTFIESELKNKRHNKFDEKNGEKSKIFAILTTIFTRKSIAFGISFLIISCVPFVLYYIVFDEGNFERRNVNSCVVDKIYRIPCGKTNITASECAKISCCFEATTNSCFHSEPSEYYYRYDDDTKKFVSSLKTTPFGLDSLNELNWSTKFIDDHLEIILNGAVGDPNEKSENSDFDLVQNEDQKLSLSIFRKNTKELILTTVQGPLIATENYLEITLQMADHGAESILFGLGQLKIDLDENTTLTKVIYKNRKDHNTLPIFMAYNNEKYHAVVVKNYGVLEIKVLPSYLIFLRSISDDFLEIDVYDGPNPKDIYMKLNAGNDVSNTIPELFFGIHLCREDSVNDLNELQEKYENFIENYTKSPFEYDTDCIHDDLLLHFLAENYTNSQIQSYFKKLDFSKKFMLSYPPQIPVYSDIFERNKEKNLFFQTVDGENYVGVYKKFDVVYPNYKSEEIEDFLMEIRELFDGTEIYGITLTNSWPQDDSFVRFNFTEAYFDEDVKDALSDTLPYYLKENSDIHLKFHNEYGSELRKKVEKIFATNFSLSSTSNFNENRFIVQNVNTTWVDLENSLTRSLSNSLFGFTDVSIPVCGSTGYDKTQNEDLCLRWYLFAATMPLFRISPNDGISRDPSDFHTKYFYQKTVEILEKRRKFVPYFRKISSNNEPLIRPMFYNFPNEKVQNLIAQYMIGDAILVAQPMLADLQEIDVYLPSGRNWYELWGGMKYSTKKNEEFIKFPIVKSDWVSFILEGSIMAQMNEETNKIDFIIAENCTKICTAKGSVVLNVESQDVAVDFTWSDRNLTVETSDGMREKIESMIDKNGIVVYS